MVTTGPKTSSSRTFMPGRVAVRMVGVTMEPRRSPPANTGVTFAPGPEPDVGALRAARRRLLFDMLGIIASAAGFGIVFGLTARANGFSAIEAVAFSLLVFAGASQFAAAGMIGAGFGWPAIVVLTAYDYPQYAAAALRLGAAGFVLKTAPIAVVVRRAKAIEAARRRRPAPGFGKAMRVIPRPVKRLVASRASSHG